MESQEHESIQFELSEQLKAQVRNIFYDKDDGVLSVYALEKPNDPIVSNVYKGLKGRIR